MLGWIWECTSINNDDNDDIKHHKLALLGIDPKKTLVCEPLLLQFNHPKCPHPKHPKHTGKKSTECPGFCHKKSPEYSFGTQAVTRSNLSTSGRRAGGLRGRVF